MALQALSDTTSGSTKPQPTPALSPARPSSKAQQLADLEGHIARLELQVRDRGEAETGSSAKHRKPYILAVLGAEQICWNTEVFRTGTQAYGALEEVVREDMGGAEVDVLAFLVGDTGRMGRRNLSETELLVLGFNEGLGGALAVGVLVQSAKAANSKVEALIRLHGADSSCTRIVLGNRFRSLVDPIESEDVVAKTYLMSEGLKVKGDEHEQPEKGPDGSPESEAWTLPSVASPTSSSGEEHQENGEEYEGERLQINPELRIWKQDPPLCHNFYLLDECTHGNDCHFSHHYDLDPSDLDALAAAVKYVPCDSVKRQPPHRPCLLGSDCIYGHVCPYDERCTWNPCKFSDEEHPNKTALERRSYALRGRGRGGPRGARGGYQARGGREGTRVQSWRKSAEEDGWGS